MDVQKEVLEKLKNNDNSSIKKKTSRIQSALNGPKK